MPNSLELIRAGRRILHKVAPNLPTEFTNLTDLILNPVGEPQRAYMWEVDFFDVDGSRTSEKIRYYAKSISVPPRMNDIIKRTYCGAEYAYSGKDTSPRVFRVTFWDSQDLEVYRYFNHWFDTMQHGSDKIKATQENYNRSVQIRLKDTTDYLINQKINLTNVFPMEISEIQMEYESSAEITFDVLFYFQHRELTK